MSWDYWQEPIDGTFRIRKPVGDANRRIIGHVLQEHHARLIAAAPDLLAALKRVLAVADRKTEEFDAARAAIAKAEGRNLGGAGSPLQSAECWPEGRMTMLTMDDMLAIVKPQNDKIVAEHRAAEAERTCTLLLARIELLESVVERLSLGLMKIRTMQGDPIQIAREAMDDSENPTVKD